MASGSDPLADMQNMIGYAGLVGQNPYLQYQGKIPMAGFYTGNAGNMPPTDATGQPIQSFVNANNNAQQQLANQPAQGTTLNSTPQGLPAAQQSALGQWGPAINELAQNSAAAQAAKTPQQLGVDAQNNAVRQQMLQQQANMSDVAGAPGGFGNMPGGAFNSGSYVPQQLPSAPGASASTGGGPPSPPDMRQAYLNALSNPGPLRTYGAAPPQAGQALTGSVTQPNVLQQFLANNGGRSVPGGYSNQGIFNSLKQQQGVT